MSINPAALQHMISLDTAATESLKLLMQRERELLEQREHTDLPALIEQKEELLARLGAHALQRQELLKSLNLPADASGWESFMSDHPALTECREPWKRLTQLFAECQELNEINGRMITRSRQTLSNLLNIVRGQSAGPKLYNQSGIASGQGGSQSLTHA